MSNPNQNQRKGQTNMKIIIINGSHRKNSATALILHEIYQKLETYPNVEIQFYNVADLNLKYCVGCCKCYKNGKCIFNDDQGVIAKWKKHSIKNRKII